MPSDTWYAAAGRKPECVAITGASRGLGAALARAYAGKGVRLVLAAHRERALLEAVTLDCERLGSLVTHSCFDAADRDAARAWITQAEQQAPIDLLIVNAGQFSGNGPGGTLEPLDKALSQISANLAGAVTTVDAAVAGMRRRRSGTIALVSSLAAKQPLADAPAYSATKAGLAAYGEAMRELLAPDGISVAVIYPGNIETQQTSHHVGALPLMMKPEQAARIIRNGLAKGRTSIAFPSRLMWLIRVGRFLPWRLRALAGRSLRFHVEDEK